MKLVILTQYFIPEIGAPSNRLLELSKRLIKDGWEVSVVTGMPNYPKGRIFDEYRGKFKSEETAGDIKILRYWLYASNSHKRIPRIISMLSFSFTSLLSLFRLKKYNADYLFVESPPLTLGLSAYLLSLFSGSKLIMNVSDIWPLTAKELGVIGDGFLYDQIEKLEKFLYKKSFLCTGQSEEIINHISKTAGEKVYLFRNGVEVSRFQKPALHDKENGNIKIVYAGLIGVAQGIPDIAMNINFTELGAEFHIYGEGAERNILEKYINSNPGRNIFLHESVKRDEIPELLSEYYCTIIPLVNNIYGAVPSKIYEAMAAGLPVLFSGSGEGAKIIRDNKAGLISEPKDFETLKKNILEIKNSIELRNEISLNCRNLAESKFDRDRLTDEFSKKLISLKSSNS
ncbi:MAG: glycosyltransferase family 4 protein [Bacteroidetes bacterium]|nr:glycosyltransferase family 4 protein [Bacteroidota bacterium]